LLDKLSSYATPTLFQGFIKPTPFFFNYAVVVVLRIEFNYALLEMPPEMLNRIEIR
jgi:hypothetical protein